MLSLLSTPLALSASTGVLLAALALPLLTASSRRSLAAERSSATSSDSGTVASTAAPAPACTLFIFACSDCGPFPFHASMSASDEAHFFVP